MMESSAFETISQMKYMLSALNSFGCGIFQEMYPAVGGSRLQSQHLEDGNMMINKAIMIYVIFCFP